MSFEENLSFFPFGTQYHRAPTPLATEWAGDLAEIARAGYTHVQFRPQWRCHERLRGRHVWDDLDRLCDLAELHGLRVVLKPMLETAPDWVFDDLAGTRIGFHGQPITAHANSAYYVGGWWPCFDNPGVAQAASEFIGVMVERYRSHPALWMYNAWNEPRSRPLGACQCPHSQTAYRNWLRSRYGSIERLNAHLGKSWTSWETLHPPAAANDHVEMALWRHWAAHSVAAQVRLVADAIHGLHPGAQVMAHVGACSVLQDPACDTSDDLLVASQVDRYGMSMPVNLHPRSPLDHDQVDFLSDWMRRVDALYWVHEFYPNGGWWSQPAAPADLRRLIWASLAGGCSAFTFWQWRSERFGFESNGFGLREINGSATPRSRVADQISGIISQYGHYVVGSRRMTSPLKLMYCRQSDMAGRVACMRGGIGNIQLEEGNLEYAYKRSLTGMHALLAGAGYDVDMVVPGDRLSDDDVLVLVGAEIITAATASWLTGFAARGGRLIVEFPFACCDERTWVEPERPSHHLEALLGCREADRIRAENDEACFAKGSIPAFGWRIGLMPTTGTSVACWKDTSVAAVAHRYGKGQVWSLGVSLGYAMAQRNSLKGPEVAVLADLFSHLGLQAPEWAHPQIRVRRRVARDGSMLWFVSNGAEESLRLPRIAALASATTIEVWDGAACTCTAGVLELAAGAVWVARVVPANRPDAGDVR